MNGSGPDHGQTINVVRGAKGGRETLPSLRLALVVQRYGEEVNGGAEYHCRLVAEHLAKHHRVEVLTSCAKDYITWRNELPAESSMVNGIRVRRFKVKRPRDADRFGRISQKVFRAPHREQDELQWLEEQGPYSPQLIRFLRKNRAEYDYFVFFSYRYYHSYHGVSALADRSLLVPTAEKDEVVELKIFRPFFHLPRAIVFNSIEERQMIWSAAESQDLKGDVVGVGAEVPNHPSPDIFRSRHRIRDRYAIFIGRVDENKGCRQLFHYFRRYKDETGSSLGLVLVGGRTMEVLDHPSVYYAGFLSEEEKWSALAGSEFLIMPSELESLSMVILESWALAKPVLANGLCDVLRGQCQRSNAGLYYTNYYEFRETVELLKEDRRLREGLGENGRRFFQEHYRWDVIEAKYNRLLAMLHREDQTRGRVPRDAPRGLFQRWRERAS
jgi:glycosyltransferase involved in cell wall biosynthesis